MIEIYQVDAFTDKPFAGNPAAVCLLKEAADAAWMQAVAAEMNLSETAFLVPQADGYHLRWFTPAVEVDLCGHATLASAYVLWETGNLAADAEARFHTKSGLLTAVLAIILTTLIIFGLKTPMLGTWVSYTAIVLALLFTSLSLGFAISVISQTDSQAVQFSMIVLLASIFFSGFFIALHRLLTGVQIVSWLLPATYGTVMLQDVMLRGKVPNPLLLTGLLSLGMILFIFGWWRLRHLMARE